MKRGAKKGTSFLLAEDFDEYSIFIITIFMLSLRLPCYIANMQVEAQVEATELLRSGKRMVLYTTIGLRKTTKSKLDKNRAPGQCYNGFICQLVDLWEKTNGGRASYVAGSAGGNQGAGV